MPIILLLLGLPLVEIALFVLVGQAIGLWPTLALVVLAAVAGVFLVRVNGLQALMRMRASIAAGEDPVGPMAHGALSVVAGILLIVPGFFTDALGLLLLLPPVQTALIARVAARARVRATRRATPHGPRAAGARTIEGEFERIDDPAASGPSAPSGPRSRSGWTRPD
jgi:UPF0716 protein FxsA